MHLSKRLYGALLIVTATGAVINLQSAHLLLKPSLLSLTLPQVQMRVDCRVKTLTALVHNNLKIEFNSKLKIYTI